MVFPKEPYTERSKNTNWMRSSLYLILFFSWLAMGSSCGYSFKGITVPEGAETIQVDFFQTEAALADPSLSTTVTEDLKEECQRYTNLDLVNSEGDLIFSGSITRYDVTPLAPTADETTALNRLTISLRVEYRNVDNEDDGWTSTFSRYEDFSSDQLLSDVEDELIPLIVEQLIDDIFNKAFGNW